MATQVADILDLVTLTLPDFQKYKFTDISSDYQETTAFKRIFRKGKTKTDSSGDGQSIKWQLMTDTNGSFRFVGIGFTAQLAMPSTFIQGEVPRRGWTWNWSIDGVEASTQGSSTKIFDMMKGRFFAGKGDMIKGVERFMWRAPSTTSDAMFGLPYYIVKSTTAATFANNDGFNGLVPSGWSTVAGLNPTTYTRWRNYATQYTNVTKTDWARKARRMAEKIRFMPLVDDMPIYDVGNDYESYTNYGLYEAVVEMAESQNDNLGADVASMDGGKVMFRRAKMNWLPALEDDTTNPFYMVDWATFIGGRQNGWFEKEIKIEKNPQQPTMVSTHYVTRANLICVDRRRNGVIATDTTMPT